MPPSTRAKTVVLGLSNFIFGTLHCWDDLDFTAAIRCLVCSSDEMITSSYSSNLARACSLASVLHMPSCATAFQMRASCHYHLGMQHFKTCTLEIDITRDGMTS